MFDKSLEFSSSLHTIHMLNPNWTVQQCVYILIFQKYRAFTLRLTQQHGISVDFSEARPNQPYRPESTFYTECVRCETSLEFTLWIYRRYRISNLKGGKMALGSCHTCIKYLMFAFNFLFWVSGLKSFCSFATPTLTRCMSVCVYIPPHIMHIHILRVSFSSWAMWGLGQTIVKTLKKMTIGAF